MGPILVYLSFVIICVGALWRPVIGALGYVAFVSFTPQWLWRFTLFDPLFPFQKYIAFATVLGFVVHGLPGAPFTRVAKIAWGAMLLYFGLSTISAFSSIAPGQSWFFLDVLYKELIMAILVMRLVDSPGLLKTAVLLIVLGIGFNAIEINRDYFSTGYSLVNQDGWALQNANGYALVLTLASCLSLAAALDARQWHWRGGLLALALIDLHAIYIVEARGAMLGMIASGLLFVVLIKKTSRNVMLGVAGGLCALVLAGPSVHKEFMSSFDENLDASAESRFFIWDAGMRITRDYPVFGVGPWAAEYLVPQYYYGDLMARDRIHLHNLPLEISTGSGVPALLMYCTFFLVSLKAGLGVLRRDRALAGPDRVVELGVVTGMAGYWVGSIFNSGALLEVPYVCIALLLAAVAMRERMDTVAPPAPVAPG